MLGIDSLMQRTGRVIESKPMPLRTRLAAVHGDADQAAKELDNMARRFHLDIARLLADEDPAPRRRGLRFGLDRPVLQSAPGVVAAPVPTA
jgi:hypothetical protein